MIICSRPRLVIGIVIPELAPGCPVALEAFDIDCQLNPFTLYC